MRILHFSDTHLGYSELDKTGPDGINLREMDFYRAFTHVVDRALEEKPDLILHAGDFFHRPSPTNRAMIFALEQLQRLSAAAIPIVIIAGNHSTPRTVYTSPILRAFQTLEHVHPIFGQHYDRVEIGNVWIHGVPHINDPKKQLSELEKVAPVNGKQNILMLHTSIGRDFMMEEYGEQLYPPERMDVLRQFDYVALGHWHNYQQVKDLPNAWYSGSLERMSDTEAGKDKGFCWLELKDKEKPIPTFEKYDARPWERIDLLDCHTHTVAELENELVKKVGELNLTEGILSIYFHDIEAGQALELNNRKLAELFPDILHIHAKRFFRYRKEMASKIASNNERLDLIMEDYIKSEIDDEKDANKISEKARYYFHIFESGEYRKK